MPKIKTNRGAAKRLRVTKTGRFKFTRARRRHLLEDKSGKKGHEMRRSTYVHPSDERRMRQLLPYS